MKKFTNYLELEVSNLKKLEIGEYYKYVDLCKILEVEYHPSGSTKKLLLKQLACYIDFTKSGQYYLINGLKEDKISEYVSEDNTVHSTIHYRGKNLRYSVPIFWDWADSQTGSVYITSQSKLSFMLGINTESFCDIQDMKNKHFMCPLAYKEFRVMVINFQHTTIRSLLRHLKRYEYIDYKKVGIGDSEILTENDNNKVNIIRQETAQDLGYSTPIAASLSKKSKKYAKTVEKALSEELGITDYYPMLEIKILNNQHPDYTDELSVEESKKQLNQIMCNYIYDRAYKKHKDYMKIYNAIRKPENIGKYKAPEYCYDEEYIREIKNLIDEYIKS